VLWVRRFPTLTGGLFRNLRARLALIVGTGHFLLCGSPGL
jgi:hypothetical protein